MIKMEIRRIRAEEWKVFKTLRLAALERDSKQFGQSYELLREYSDERWKEDTKKGAESNDLFLIFAFDNTEPVGMSACFITKEFGKIFAVWVKPEYRGNGLGRCLVQATIDIAVCKRYKLSVVEDNIPAIKTYNNLGFIATGFSYVNEKGFREIEMIKEM